MKKTNVVIRKIHERHLMMLFFTFFLIQMLNAQRVQHIDRSSDPIEITGYVRDKGDRSGFHEREFVDRPDKGSGTYKSKNKKGKPTKTNPDKVNKTKVVYDHLIVVDEGIEFNISGKAAQRLQILLQEYNDEVNTSIIVKWITKAAAMIIPGKTEPFKNAISKLSNQAFIQLTETYAIITSKKLDQEMYNAIKDNRSNDVRFFEKISSRLKEKKSIDIYVITPETNSLNEISIELDIRQPIDSIYQDTVSISTFYQIVELSKISYAVNKVNNSDNPTTLIIDDLTLQYNTELFPTLNIVNDSLIYFSCPDSTFSDFLYLTSKLPVSIKYFFHTSLLKEKNSEARSDLLRNLGHYENNVILNGWLSVNSVKFMNKLLSILVNNPKCASELKGSYNLFHDINNISEGLEEVYPDLKLLNWNSESLEDLELGYGQFYLNALPSEFNHPYIVNKKEIGFHVIYDKGDFARLYNANFDIQKFERELIVTYWKDQKLDGEKLWSRSDLTVWDKFLLEELRKIFGLP